MRVNVFVAVSGVGVVESETPTANVKLPAAVGVPDNTPALGDRRLRDVLTKAAPLTPEEKIALFRKLRAMTPLLEDVDVRAAIRRGRDDEFDG